MTEEKFERITRVALPFDQRNADDNKNYGIHGLDIWFILKGKKGAVQFAVNFPVYLPHVDREYIHRFPDWNTKKEIRGFDVGYHSFWPHYEGQKSMGSCEVLDGANCYYDGSSLASDRWVENIFSIRGKRPDETMWEMLTQEYKERFTDDK